MFTHDCIDKYDFYFSNIYAMVLSYSGRITMQYIMANGSFSAHQCSFSILHKISIQIYTQINGLDSSVRHIFNFYFLFSFVDDSASASAFMGFWSILTSPHLIFNMITTISSHKRLFR